jgi:hypothetical protein
LKGWGQVQPSLIRPGARPADEFHTRNNESLATPGTQPAGEKCFEGREKGSKKRKKNKQKPELISFELAQE